MTAPKPKSGSADVLSLLSRFLPDAKDRESLKSALTAAAPTEAKKATAGAVDGRVARVQAICEEVYAGAESLARDVATKARQQAGTDGDSESLSYGEVDVQSLAMLAAKMQLSAGCSFVDLGSGVGRNAVAVSLLYPEVRCSGVELLAGLHDIATGCLKKLAKLEAGGGESKASDMKHQPVHLVLGSLTSWDWSGFDAVFCNSTLFSAELMTQLLKCALKLKSGARLLVFTHKLEHEELALLHSFDSVSFYKCAVFLYRRK